MNSSPVRMRPAAKRSSKSRRTAGTSDEPPVRNTRSTAPGATRACGRSSPSTQPAIAAELGRDPAPRSPPRLTSASICSTSWSMRKRGGGLARESARLVCSMARWSTKPRSFSTTWSSRSRRSGSTASRRRSSSSWSVAARLQHRDVVPALEVRVDPARARAGARPKNETELGAAAEQRRHAVAHELAVEGVARDVHAVVAEDRAGAPSARAGADAQQREVAGAAAEVADQEQLVALEAALVVAGGADRLVLEARRRGSPRCTSACAQARERERVVLVARGAHEAHRPPDHGRPHRRRRARPRPPRAAARAACRSAARAGSCARRSRWPRTAGSRGTTSSTGSAARRAPRARGRRRAPPARRGPRPDSCRPRGRSRAATGRSASARRARRSAPAAALPPRR